MSTSFVDDSGATRFRGRLEGGGWKPARNVGQCRLDFAGVAGDLQPIAFVFGQGDATFIDLSVPASPRPVVAGIYAYTLVVVQPAGGAGGAFFALLRVDDDWYSLSAEAGHETQATSGGDAGAQVTIAVAWYSDAASPFFASVSDSSADTYQGSLYVQRLA